MHHADPTRRPPALIVRTPAADTLRDVAVAPRRVIRRRVERRGIVLVFVVVLLTLLGIMGTAYLATSRIDRQSILAGRGALPNETAPLLKDARQLDAIEAGIERAAKLAIVRDLFNVPPGVKSDTQTFDLLAKNGAFRQSLSTRQTPIPWYENFDAPGRADAWLSSLLPDRGGPAANPFVWPWITAPLGVNATSTAFAEPFFSDPRLIANGGFAVIGRYAAINPDQQAIGQPIAGSGQPANAWFGTPVSENNGLTQRNNVPITSVTLTRSGATAAAGPLADNTRVYPGLVVLGNDLIAGDADGDGIADGGLMPIALDPTVNPNGANAINRYLDPVNNVVYFAAYRIVDNSAKLNLATALDNRGEIVEMQVNPSSSAGTTADENADSRQLSTGNAPAELREFLTEDPESTTFTFPKTVVYGPNYGFFRANVGLTGMLRSLLAPINPAADPTDYQRTPAQQELRRFVDARFPLLKQNPSSTYQGTPGNDDKDMQKLAVTFTKADVAQLGFSTSGRPDAAPNPALAAGPIYPFQFRSFGDLIEQQVARRPLNPGGYLWASSPANAIGGTPNPDPAVADNALKYFGVGDAESLAAKGGALVAAQITPGTAETALQFALRLGAPNVNNNGETPWGWFPPGAWDLWFGWTQDFSPVPGVAAAGQPSAIAAIDAGVTGTPLIPGSTVADRAFNYGSANAEVLNKPAGTADVRLPRSPRALLTSYNGVTTVAPQRGDRGVNNTLGYPTTFGLPIGMPAYSAADVRIGGNRLVGNSIPLEPASPPFRIDDPSFTDAPSVNFFYPQRKVSAATGTKEQLWRAFWSAMTVQRTFNYNVSGFTQVFVSSFWDAPRKPVVPLPTMYNPDNFYDAFRSSDRYASNERTTTNNNANSRQYLPPPASAFDYDERVAPTEVLSTRQMALIRSAVAACNTIDLRDRDNDITAMDVDITDNNVVNNRYYARIYGTEKQLVITGVYLERGGATKYVAVEIYNPSDIPIQLSAYRLGVLERSGVVGNYKATGVLAPPAGGTTDPIRLSTSTADFVQPGGYVVVSSQTAPPDTTRFTPVVVPDPGHTNGPAAGVADVWTIDPSTTPTITNLQTTLESLLSNSDNRDLVLFRTRRADGVAFVDQTATASPTPIRATIENEIANSAGVIDTTANTDIRTLVPVDAVDCRLNSTSLLTAPVESFVYQRQRPAVPGPDSAGPNPLIGGRSLTRPGAWRCFYAGKFYDLRVAGQRITKSPINAATANDYAWRELDGTAPVEFASPLAALYDPSAGAGKPNRFLAPAIPIQNFEPYDPFTATNTRVNVGANARLAAGQTMRVIAGPPIPALRGVFHLINQFPFGSPFVREMDLQAIPFIGTYKIYRSTGGAVPELYEVVPLPMDAVAVAPNLLPAEVADSGVTPTQLTKIGRFYPGLGEGPSTPSRTNEWAANLTDFVTARDFAAVPAYPNVPNATIDKTIFDVRTSPSPAGQDQRYAQDGPLAGTGVANTFDDVPYVTFTERTAGTDAALDAGAAPTLRQGRRKAIDVLASEAATLQQGVLNLNTAPQILLRQLPWTVDPDTGYVDFTGPAAALEPRTRTIVNALTLARDARAAIPPTSTPATADLQRSFGFSSMPSLAKELATEAGNVDVSQLFDRTGLALTAPTAEQAMRLGMLRPIDRPENEADYRLGQLNLARISNLASTRSDVFTVYVTVQAWTYVGNVTGANQQNDTRLVGERRASFIVDRSRVTELNYDPANLVVLPIEKE